jgi:hypothetical protein
MTRAYDRRDRKGLVGAGRGKANPAGLKNHERALKLGSPVTHQSRDGTGEILSTADRESQKDHAGSLGAKCEYELADVLVFGQQNPNAHAWPDR